MSRGSDTKPRTPDDGWRETTMRRLAAIAAVLVACSLAGAPAQATIRSGKATIEVFPGPHALGDALAIANPGDTLNIHAGTYGEHVTVRTDDLTLQNAGDGTVIVDGTCSATDTIKITSDGVTIRSLRVIGAGAGFAPKEIDFVGVRSGRVLDSEVEDTCGNAEYGVNVFNSGSIRVIGTSATGFADAGIYIGQITSTHFGPLVLAQNDSYGNVRGIIVENSSGGQIVVRGNSIHDNTTNGIWITNSDGVLIRGNMVLDNADAGIQLDSLSDDNMIRRNVAQGQTFDLANDGGSGNCFLGNTYTTSSGDISC
jgi:parallel beta-helix repeat protein